MGDSEDIRNPHTNKWKAAAFPSLLVGRSLHQPVTLPLQTPQHCSNLSALIQLDSTPQARINLHTIGTPYYPLHQPLAFVSIYRTSFCWHSWFCSRICPYLLKYFYSPGPGKINLSMSDGLDPLSITQKHFECLVHHSILWYKGICASFHIFGCISISMWLFFFPAPQGKVIPWQGNDIVDWGYTSEWVQRGLKRPYKSGS